METLNVSPMPIDDISYLEFQDKQSFTDKPNNFILNDLVNEQNSDRNDTIKYIELILQGISMENYLQVFINENLDLNTFLNLTKQDLIELGITTKKDQEVILENLKVHRSEREEFVVCENLEEDLRIAKNIYSQMIIVQNYLAYFEFQMKKHKVTDYRISQKESAAMYLKLFIELTLSQTDVMSKALYETHCSNNLINKILQNTNFELPKHLKDKLDRSTSKKVKKKRKVLKLIAIIGISSMFILVGQHMLKKT